MEANINYHGSCSIDRELMEKAGIVPNEQIQIYNVNNGERFTTYAIPSSIKGMIALNGSAARLGIPGDLIIICTYGMIESDSSYVPKVVFVNDKNEAIEQ
jgi:aspartate 1-decarboxylase